MEKAEDEHAWYYLDINGDEFGPFANDVMREWFMEGAFPLMGELPVRAPEWRSHVPLKVIYNDLREAFKPIPIQEKDGLSAARFNHPLVSPDERFEGKIKSFNRKKGFGFISSNRAWEIFGRDVFLHKAQFWDVEIGSMVKFRVEINKEGMPQAREVVQIHGPETVGWQSREDARKPKPRSRPGPLHDHMSLPGHLNEHQHQRHGRAGLEQGMYRGPPHGGDHDPYAYPAGRSGGRQQGSFPSQPFEC